ncbi:hypothetical protein [Leptospira dzoumogneensis]|uniref:Uncharacterized protein n=1 Tax=Leptospira dzoumogneensis TaxID=2484904 RepID=A0A4Z1AP68_9LEPT|nr:hypothetical protein [Leptospira dzoumogneensis]TGM99606.1 hypothetical protein EHR06_10795 [Leptospira dzoumogneensis]
MHDSDLRINLLLSLQRALLGMVYHSIRAIIVEYEGLQFLRVTAYLDREPEDSDYENLSEVTSNVLADLNFQKVEEVCLYFADSLSNIKNKGIWIYERKED